VQVDPTQGSDDSIFTIDAPDAAGPFFLVCEHASNRFPAEYGTLGLDDEAQAACIAWDPGALGLAQNLSRLLDAPLFSARVSRLIYDLNRPPLAATVMPAQSKGWQIPGNADLTAQERLRRLDAIYIPFHDRLRREILRRVMLATETGQVPVLVTVHSFAPVVDGEPRSVEFGVIHDADPLLAQAVVDLARETTPLITALNEPYSETEDITHTLRLQATPCGIANVMLEIRNDLLSTPEAQAHVAAMLAPVLRGALERITA
jgi:predicted N-formylglutamate amidohydrolase